MQYFLYVMFVVLIIFFVVHIRRSLKRSRKTVELIGRYWNDKNNPKLIDEIYDFVMNDPRLSQVAKQYNADKRDFAKLYKKLLIWGDFKKYNRFIPINSFFYASALKYILEHKDDDAKSLTQKMMNYFHI